MRPDFIFDSSRLDILSNGCLSQKRLVVFSFPILSLTHGSVSTYRRLGHARYPFHPSDLMHAGTLQDISSLWSEPLSWMIKILLIFFIITGKFLRSLRNTWGAICVVFCPNSIFSRLILNATHWLMMISFVTCLMSPSRNFALSRSLIDDSFVFAGFSQLVFIGINREILLYIQCRLLNIRQFLSVLCATISRSISLMPTEVALKI